MHSSEFSRPETNESRGPILAEKSFGLVLFSKVDDSRSFEVYCSNLASLFRHMNQAEFVGSVYFVDDSPKVFQDRLRQVVESNVTNLIPWASVIDVTGNGSVYRAVNRMWGAIAEDLVIFIQSDFRLIQDLSLRVLRDAFVRYAEAYLIYLRARGLFGYNPQQATSLRRTYPWYSDYKDGEQETWYCIDRDGRVYSVPCRLLAKQRNRMLPRSQWGTELVGRLIDEQNALWTPRLPSCLLSAYPTAESFAGGAVVYRANVVKEYLPLPKRYRYAVPAECLESYFWETDIDYKYYTGYLNLQAFAVCHEDPKRPLQNYLPNYWDAFLEKNSRKVLQSSAMQYLNDPRIQHVRTVHAVTLTCRRRRLAQVLRFLARRAKRFISRKIPDALRLIQFNHSKRAQLSKTAVQEKDSRDG